MTNIELRIVVDWDGVRTVQVVGDSELHHLGHDLYFLIQDLIVNFNQCVKSKIEKEKKPIAYEQSSTN